MTFPDQRCQQQLLVWWGRLDEARQTQVTAYFTGADGNTSLHEDLQQQLKRTLPRAARAELRRADSIFAVSLCAAYQQIYRQLSSQTHNPETAQRLEQEYSRDRLALLIGVLVHVEKLAEPGPERGFAAVASLVPKDDEKAPVSPLRFERLLTSPDLGDLFTGLRRMMPLLKNGFDLNEFCKDILHWNDLTRKKWAYAYNWPEKINAN